MEIEELRKLKLSLCATSTYKVFRVKLRIHSQSFPPNLGKVVCLAWTLVSSYIERHQLLIVPEVWNEQSITFTKN